MKTPAYFFTLLGSLFLLAQTAGAAVVVSQTQSSSIVGGTIHFDFDQFNPASDPQFLSLTSVQVSMVYTITTEAAYELDNDDGSPQSGTASYTISGNLSSGDVTLPSGGVSIQLQSQEATALAANTGDSIATFDVGGADYSLLPGPSGSDSDSGFVDDFNWAAYIGSGTYTISASLAQSGQFTATGFVRTQSSPAIGSVFVTVSYTYEAIPEPATAWMFLLGGSLAFRGFRKRLAGFLA